MNTENQYLFFKDVDLSFFVNINPPSMVVGKRAANILNARKIIHLNKKSFTELSDESYVFFVSQKYISISEFLKISEENFIELTPKKFLCLSINFYKDINTVWLRTLLHKFCLSDPVPNQRYDCSTEDMELAIEKIKNCLELPDRIAETHAQYYADRYASFRDMRSDNPRAHCTDRPNLFKQEFVAAKFGVHRLMVSNLLKRGDVIGEKVGKPNYIQIDSLLNYVNNQQQPGFVFEDGNQTRFLRSMVNHKEIPKFLTSEEAEELSGLNKRVLRNRALKGHCTYYKIGGKNLYLEEDIDYSRKSGAFRDHRYDAKEPCFYKVEQNLESSNNE